MRELHCRKVADYGRDHDPLANCRASGEFGIDPWIGVMVRAMDKVHRIKSFLANGKLENESVEDSLKDLAAYALIALVLFREQSKTAEPGVRIEGGPGWVMDNCTTGPVARPAERKKVYIAGPISKGDLAHNINQATAAFIALAKAGLAPWCPQWSCFSGGVNVSVLNGSAWAVPSTGGGGGLSHEDWLAIDLPWVRSADAVLRLPGESTGADRECEAAVAAGKPVFHSVEDVVAWAVSA